MERVKNWVQIAQHVSRRVGGGGVHECGSRATPTARAKLHCFSNEYTIANVAKHPRKIC